MENYHEMGPEFEDPKPKPIPKKKVKDVMMHMQVGETEVFNKLQLGSVSSCKYSISYIHDRKYVLKRKPDFIELIREK